MVKIIVFSDVHIENYPSSWNGFFDKRNIGIFNRNYFRKTCVNRIDTLKRAIKKTIDLSPNIVLFAGDLTSIGEISEFTTSRYILKPLVENTNFDLFCIPGNHDYYVDDIECSNELCETFLYLNRDKFGVESLPFNIISYGIDFCFVNECRPTFSSNGFLDYYDKKHIFNWALNESNFPKILIGHYPVTENNVWNFWRSLFGYKEILDLLNNNYIDISICGHNHISNNKLYKTGGRGEIIVGSTIDEKQLTVIDYYKSTNTFNCYFEPI